MIKKKNTVVLIEDDQSLGDSILELLNFHGYTVKWFFDGLNALDFLKNNIPDIIISDLMMPLMNGESVYVNLKKDKKYNSIPFIMISANINDEIKIKQLQNGVTDFITKPFKSTELILKIKNLLNLTNNIEKKFQPDPFSKVTIKLSEKDFLSTLNDCLLKDLKTKISIEEIASRLFISKSTLDKKVRKLTGKNSSKYIREFKLDYAIRLINSGERNIQHLVYETGFNSFSYFSTSFKSYTGVSTREFIKAIQTKE